MKRREFLAASLASAICATVGTSVSPAFADGCACCAKKKLLYFERSNGFLHPSTKIDPATGMSVGGKVLTEVAKKLGYEVVCTKDGRIFDGDLSQYDAFLLNCCGTLTGQGGGDGPNAYPMSKEGEQNFFKAIRSGAGVLGFHNATDTNKSGGPHRENAPLDQRTEYTKMIGGEFLTHGSQQETSLRILNAGELPSVPELPARIHEEWYALRNLNPDMHVLMLQETEGMNTNGGNWCYDRSPFPCTWIRMEEKGRVAYTTLAHNNSTWETDWMKAIIFDLMKFVTRKMDLDTTPNLKDVAPDFDVLCRQK
ncbi:MAG: ThuA domain-containing protein [Thermoguttaceae bacterium]|nr:ThuA domain-containing protein [Thermoguttaceae bacterium]